MNVVAMIGYGGVGIAALGILMLIEVSTRMDQANRAAVEAAAGDANTVYDMYKISQRHTRRLRPLALWAWRIIGLGGTLLLVSIALRLLGI